jgi:transposase
MSRTERGQDRRVQKFRDVLGRWEAGRLSLLDAAELLGCSERHLRRLRGRFEEDGEAGLADRRRGKPSPRAVPKAEIERMLGLYRARHRGWNAQHFHEHGKKHYRFTWGYTLTKSHLQMATLLAPDQRRGPHRRKRERKPLEGMMLHQDASTHRWLAGQPELDLVVTMDDATSTIYSAILLDEEGTESSFLGFLETFDKHGLPCAVYTDRGSHYFYTLEAGGPVDKTRPTQVGRALNQLGIEHKPAYSPEARGRSERTFQTLQDRLIKELALAGITEVAAANRWIAKVYLPEHNWRFGHEAVEPGTAFVAVATDILTEALCVEEARVVSRDNTVSFGRVRLQLPASAGRAHYVKANVKLRQYPDGQLAVFHGPRCLARYAADGTPADPPPPRARSTFPATAKVVGGGGGGGGGKWGDGRP